MHCARQSNRAGLSPTAMSPAWLLTRKGLIDHAARHRGSSACESMGWTYHEARGPRGVTTTLACVIPQGGEVRFPLRRIHEWGRGGLRVKGICFKGFMSLAVTTPAPNATQNVAKVERQKLIKHIMKMKLSDTDYAREALRWYHARLPDLDLMAGVRDALKAQDKP